MLSAPALKKAEEAINSARKAVSELFNRETSGTYDTTAEREAIHQMIRELNRVSHDIVKLECRIYGFDLWKYFSEEAIRSETWKDLEQERKEAITLRRKKASNEHCRALGLNEPYPEIEE